MTTAPLLLFSTILNLQILKYRQQPLFVYADQHLDDENTLTSLLPACLRLAARSFSKASSNPRMSISYVCILYRGTNI